MFRKTVVKSFILIAGCFTLSLPALAQFTPEQIQAMMPSKAEMRQGLVESGMTPAQIDQILSGMDFQNEAPAAANKPGNPDGACVDEDANGVCDEAEDGDILVLTDMEPVCADIYANAMTKFVRDRYNSDLGRSVVEIAQTCVTAAPGGLQYFGYPKDYTGPRDGSGAWCVDTDALVPLANYLDGVRKSGLRSGEFPDRDMDIDIDNLDALLATLPRDLRSLMTPAAAGVSADGSAFRDLALPIHNKCEVVRKRVGAMYNSKVVDKRVCEPVPPMPDDKEGDE